MIGNWDTSEVMITFNTAFSNNSNEDKSVFNSVSLIIETCN